MIVISDLHIGREDCQIDEVVEFLQSNETDLLILNGDILDQFAIFKDRVIFKEHWPKVKAVWKILKERKTKIIYLVGNHDYLMFLLAPIGFLLGIKIRKRIVRGEFLIEHGDWISYYLRLRRLKSGTYEEDCDLFAKIKKKMLIVGHSHRPRKTKRVIDVGDWVGHGTYYSAVV